MSAQYDAAYAHYWAMETSFNPAATGKEKKINVTAAYNNTLTGFENNPRTMYASADMPFYAIGSFHGVGAMFQNDQIGLFTHTKMSLQYSYKHTLFGGMLSIGAQVGMLSEKFDGTKVDTDTPTTLHSRRPRSTAAPWTLAQAYTMSMAGHTPDCRCSISTRPWWNWAKETILRLTLHIILREDTILI